MSPWPRCTCKAAAKTGSFGCEIILMRALDPSAPYRHRHVGHSTVPGVLVWDTGARWTRKIIWLQKGFPRPCADANYGGVWFVATSPSHEFEGYAPSKKHAVLPFERVKQRITNNQGVKTTLIVWVPSQGAMVHKKDTPTTRGTSELQLFFAIADLHPSCSVLLSGGKIVAGLQAAVTAAVLCFCSLHV